MWEKMWMTCAGMERHEMGNWQAVGDAKCTEPAGILSSGAELGRGDSGEGIPFFCVLHPHG